MPPLSIMIKPVSSSCNMNCRYCFYADVSNQREHKSLGRMSAQTLENLVRRALAYADDHISFAFQGGEPSLAGADFYKLLLELEKKYNSRGISIQNSIQTNGYNINDELLEILKRGEFLVGVSFDGTPEIHNKLRIDRDGNGTADTVKKTIDKLSRLDIDFNILCVVNRYVAEQAKKTFSFLEKYKYIQYIPCLDPFDGAQYDFSLTPEMYAEFSIQTFELYYKALKAGKPVSVRNFDNYISVLLGMPPENCGMCGRCGQYYLIEADGGVYPCDFYVLDQWNIGNINDASFFKLAKSEIGQKFRNDSLHISTECVSCKWFTLCKGGCRRDREPFRDGLPLLNKWCKSYKMFFESCEDKLKDIADFVSSGSEM